MAKMTTAVLQGFLASITFSQLARGTLSITVSISGSSLVYKSSTNQSRIERAMTVWRTVVLDIVKQSIGYLKNSLIGNVLIRPR